MKDKRWFRFGLSAVAGVLVCAANLSQAQNPPSRAVVFSEVVKLTQAHQSDDVITGYVQNSGASFALTADEIIYLSNQGVSQKVIAALQSRPTTPAIPAAPAVPSAPGIPAAPGVPGAGTVDANFNSFHDRLATSGTWVDVPGYGQCWQPGIEATNPSWRPYYDRGHWVYTDSGWYWQSDDPWGEIVFHYGRWQLAARGWVWVPGYDWGPSWVAWRHSDGYLGWAPLPPEARFEVGVGLSFRGRVGVDLDFGLGEGLFTFVGYDHFWEHDFRRFAVPHDRVAIIFRGSRIENNYRVMNGHFVNEGLGHERIAALTHHDVRVERVVARDHPVVIDREREHDRAPIRSERDRKDGRPFGDGHK